MSKIRVMGMIYACGTKTSRILSASVNRTDTGGGTSLGSYFGTEEQQRMQRKSDRLTPWIMRTPGACLTGRVMATDDPETLGWDIIHEHLQEDGVFSFRWVDQPGLDRIRQQTQSLGATIHGWDGYCSDAETLRQAMSDPLSRELPEGMTRQIVDSASVSNLQRFFAQNSIAPLSAAVLTGGNLQSAVGDPARSGRCHRRGRFRRHVAEQVFTAA